LRVFLLVALEGHVFRELELRSSAVEDLEPEQDSDDVDQEFDSAP
jgi:hypothetical protein